MKLNFLTHEQNHTEASVYFLTNSKLTGKLSDLDQNGDITKAIEVSRDFTWQEGQVIHILAPTYSNANHIFLFYIADCNTIFGMQKIGAKLSELLNKYKLCSASLFIENQDLDPKMWAGFIFGAKLRNYNFEKYYIKRKQDYKTSLESLSVISPFSDSINAEFASFDAISDGIIKTRDLVSEPANVLFPEAFAQECLKLKELGVTIKILDEEEMLSLGMGALIGVGQGSINKPYTVIMEWNPKSQGQKTISIAGKGVCFDSGGLNIKSAASNIADMKDDMAGAAAVFGTLYSVAKQKLNVRLIGIIGLVENSTSGTAQRPSDVVTTMSGQTVEVENTDAEGRLVLCDIMCYVQKQYKPDYLIDIATLTGAITTALGEGGYAGLFSNNDELADEIIKLGLETGEVFWRLPLSDYYDKQIDSDIADMRNTGTGKGGGATIAAQFLQRFVEPGTKWAHLDIANVAWNKKGTALSPKGATGFGVAILEAFVKSKANKS